MQSKTKRRDALCEAILLGLLHLAPCVFERALDRLRDVNEIQINILELELNSDQY